VEKWSGCAHRYQDVLRLRNARRLPIAAIGAYEKTDKATRKAWFDEGQKKVVLKVQSERELL